MIRYFVERTAAHSLKPLLQNHSKAPVKPTHCAQHHRSRDSPCDTIPENRGKCWVTVNPPQVPPPYLQGQSALCWRASKYSEVYSVGNPGESKPWLSLPPQNLRRVSKAELSAHHTWSPLETELSQNLLCLLSPRNAVISPPKERQYLDSDLPLFMQYLPCD